MLGTSQNMSARYDLSRLHFGATAAVRLQSSEPPAAGSLTARVDKNTDLDAYPNENGTVEKMNLQKMLGTNDLVGRIANDRRAELNRRVAPAAQGVVEDERSTRPKAIADGERGTGVEIQYGRLSREEIPNPLIGRRMDVQSRYYA